MTPLQRLAQVYWLNFFGQPYVDFPVESESFRLLAMQKRCLNMD
jgi:hypothetical protein